MVEQCAVNALVGGSNPSEGADIELLCNGSTSGFGPDCPGSTPGSLTIIYGPIAQMVRAADS